ncbi:hypothetical protein FOZ61_001346, partial [Perkinsus olseni]
MSSEDQTPGNQLHSTGIGTQTSPRVSARLAGLRPVQPLEDPERLLRQQNDAYVTPISHISDQENQPPQTGLQGDTTSSQTYLQDVLRELAAVRSELNRARAQTESSHTKQERPAGVSVKAVFDVFDLPVIGPWDPNDQKAVSYEYFKEQVRAQAKLYGMQGPTGVHYLMRCVSNKLQDEIRAWALQGVLTIDDIFVNLDQRFCSEWQQQARWFRWESKQLDQQRGENVTTYVSRWTEASLYAGYLTN